MDTGTGSGPGGVDMHSTATDTARAEVPGPESGIVADGCDTAEDDLLMFAPTVELRSPRRRTGLIFAVPLDCPAETAVMVAEQLRDRFPDVVVAVAPGASSIAFEWEEPE